MEFNTIILCFILWGFVEFIAILASIFHRITLRQEHIAKKKYMQRLLELSHRGVEPNDLIKELYYSFMGDNRLRIMLLHCLRYQPERAFKYIYSKLGCEPMRVIHNYLIKKISREEFSETRPLIPIGTMEYLMKEIDKWDADWCHRLKLRKKKKLQALLEKNLIQIIILFLYLSLQTEQSLVIFAIVNTIGVIMFIILDYECCVVDEKVDEGNLASKKYAKKMSQAVASGVENIYQLVASMGLIINITTVVMNWLGPVA